MLIAVDVRTVLIARAVVIHADVFKLGGEFDLLVQGLLPLDAHHFLNGFSDIEYLIVVSEFVRLDLSEVKHVLNYEIHYLGRVLLDFLTFTQLLQNFVAGLKCFSFLDAVIKELKLDLHFLVKRRFLDVFGDDRVEWVSQLM